jgi:ABC-type transporter Mla maintaining outer membrane lipid asymmetry ATPase subunit MlaF
MDNPLIEFRNVTKRFDNRTILDQINLKIYEIDSVIKSAKSQQKTIARFNCEMRR